MISNIGYQIDRGNAKPSCVSLCERHRQNSCWSKHCMSSLILYSCNCTKGLSSGTHLPQLLKLLNWHADEVFNSQQAAVACDGGGQWWQGAQFRGNMVCLSATLLTLQARLSNITIMGSPVLYLDSLYSAADLKWAILNPRRSKLTPEGIVFSFLKHHKQSAGANTCTIHECSTGC